MNDATTPPTGPPRLRPAWEDTDDGEAFTAWSGSGFAAVGRQHDGSGPVRVPACADLRIGEPSVSRGVAQRWAENAPALPPEAAPPSYPASRPGVRRPAGPGRRLYQAEVHPGGERSEVALRAHRCLR